jgi:transcription-repair coupling factor (superfamily II helicase)
VRWKDLGLVIVDEEQRFGVEHKEHIKSLRTHVDVLTMSATPIPRTLEMSLAGIREMSTISPRPRSASRCSPTSARTMTSRWPRRCAVNCCATGRRSTSTTGSARSIRPRRGCSELVPEARVVVAHGQMNEETLEKTVEGFWNRDYDILVCTTIVETGLDISNANTLIVERPTPSACRSCTSCGAGSGAVARAGYAYFLYPPEVPLTETAHDRLPPSRRTMSSAPAWQWP